MKILFLSAGADLMLVPSRYEPCGLAQMIAMRYGAVPVVWRTGGLADTVTDYGVQNHGSGFVFRGYNSNALLKALRRALALYHHPARWQALQARAMQRAAQFSWSRSAKEYIALYRKALVQQQAAAKVLVDLRGLQDPKGLGDRTKSA